jgi:hypothetical protein
LYFFSQRCIACSRSAAVAVCGFVEAAWLALQYQPAFGFLLLRRGRAGVDRPGCQRQAAAVSGSLGGARCSW